MDLKRIIDLAVAGFLFASCAPTYYLQDQHFVSEVEKKGEFTLEGSYALNHLFAAPLVRKSSANLEVNYGLADSWVLHTGTSYFKLSENDVSDAYGYFSDIAFGYTTNVPERTFYVEGFLGYGRGNIRAFDVADDESLALIGYNSFFAQGSFSFKPKNRSSSRKGFTFHVPVRITHNNYYQIEYSDRLDNYQIDRLEDASKSPSYRTKFSTGGIVGYRKGRLKYCLYGSYYFGNDPYELLLFSDNVYVGAGIKLFLGLGSNLSSSNL